MKNPQGPTRPNRTNPRHSWPSLTQSLPPISPVPVHPGPAAAVTPLGHRTSPITSRQVPAGGQQANSSASSCSGWRRRQEQGWRTRVEKVQILPPWNLDSVSIRKIRRPRRCCSGRQEDSSPRYGLPWSVIDVGEMDADLLRACRSAEKNQVKQRLQATVICLCYVYYLV